VSGTGGLFPVTSVSPKLTAAALPMTPAVLLRRLAGAVPADAELAARPVVALHLSGGQRLEGYLLRVDAGPAQETVVLADAAGGLCYALTAGVVAVTVPTPEPVRHVLTGGAVAAPAAEPPGGRLALRRAYPPTPDFPLDLDWSALPDSAEAWANLAQLLDGLRAASERVRADELGRRAWAQVRAVRVEHHAGRSLAFERQPDGLSVRADLTAALPGQLAGELRRQLDAVL
jgi:hypothetical protein